MTQDFARALDQSLRQWKMYSDCQGGSAENIETADHAEGKLYRECKAVLAEIQAAADGDIWIWFADNGYIRKWDRKPFAEGTRYSAKPPAPGITREQIENLRHDDLDDGSFRYDRTDNRYGEGFNAALDAVLELMGAEHGQH